MGMELRKLLIVLKLLELAYNKNCSRRHCRLIDRFIPQLFLK